MDLLNALNAVKHIIIIQIKIWLHIIHTDALAAVTSTLETKLVSMESWQDWWWISSVTTVRILSAYSCTTTCFGSIVPAVAKE